MESECVQRHKLPLQKNAEPSSMAGGLAPRVLILVHLRKHLQASSNQSMLAVFPPLQDLKMRLQDLKMRRKLCIMRLLMCLL